MRLLKVFLTVVICAHIVACLWYFIAKLEGFNPDTWVSRSGYMDDNDGRIYIAAIYWSFTTMSTVGYGDITAETNIERCLAIGWMLFGVCFFSFTIGSLSSIMARIDSKEVILTNKLAIIEEFSREAKLEKDLKMRLRYALQYSTEKTGFSWADKQNIFNELPRALRYEVALAMHGGAAKTLPFFKGKDPVFISAIIPFLQPQLVEAGEMVYQEDEYADEIYFIQKGRVNYVYGENKLCYKSLQKGTYFGEIEVIRQIPRKYSIQSVVDTDLLIMNKSLMVLIITDFPIIAQEMTDISDMRDKVNDKAKYDMKQLLIKHGKEEEETPKGIDRAPQQILQESEKKNEGEGLKEDIFEQLEKLKTNLENTKSRITGIENQFITLIEEKDKTLNRNLKILDKNCRNNKNVVLMQLSEKDRVLSRIEEKLSYTSELLQNLLKVKSKTPAKRKNLLETAKKT